MTNYDSAKGMASLSVAQSVASIRQLLTSVISDMLWVAC